MTGVITWLAVIGMPASILVGGGAAFVRCWRRGELRSIDAAEVVDESRRQ